MTRFPEVLSNVILRDKAHIYGRIYVVSAYAGVTDLLLEHKKSRQPGVYSAFADQGPYAEALRAVKARFFEINAGLKAAGLDVEAANQFIGERVEGVLGYLNSTADLLASGYVSRSELLSAARELLASIGESHSAFNSAKVVQSLGYESVFIDLSGWSDPKPRTIDERIALALADVGQRPRVTFVTGYCKGTEGIMREFDRGYSEVTFSKVAVAVKADEAVIHKEFHLSSADPKNHRPRQGQARLQHQFRRR